MDINYTTDGTTLIISLIGELDEHASQNAKNTLDQLLATARFSAVIFDLNRLSFMDSTGIGVLIGRYKLLKNKNCPVYVKNASRTVDKIFTMSGLYEIMPKIS